MPESPTPVEPAGSRAPSLDKLYQEFAVLDRQCAQEVDNAIRKWSCNGLLHWPELSPNARAMLRVRLQAAEQLLHLLLLRQQEALHPPASAREGNISILARRLLIHWWKDRGHESGGDLWVAQQWSRLQRHRGRPAPASKLQLVKPLVAYAQVAA